MKVIKIIIVLIFIEIVFIKSSFCQIPNPGNYGDPRIDFGENARSILALNCNDDYNTNYKRYLISEVIKEGLLEISNVHLMSRPDPDYFLSAR